MPSSTGPCSHAPFLPTPASPRRAPLRGRRRRPIHPRQQTGDDATDHKAARGRAVYGEGVMNDVDRLMIAVGLQTAAADAVSPGSPAAAYVLHIFVAALFGGI